MDLRPDELKGIIGDIPPLPAIYQELFQRMHDPDILLPALAEIIAQDQALSAKILHLVNSAFYGYGKQVQTISRAVVILGFRTVRSAALTISVLDYFKDVETGSRADLVAFWRHGIATASICKVLAPVLTPCPVEEAFVAGLLHDVGKLIEKRYFAPDYQEVCNAAREQHLSWFECERALFQTHHAGIGKAVFRQWNFPTSLTDGIRHHHTPGLAARSPQLAALVHLADFLTYQIDYGAPGAWPPKECDPQAVKVLGFEPARFQDHLPAVQDQIATALEILTLL